MDGEGDRGARSDTPPADGSWVSTVGGGFLVVVSRPQALMRPSWPLSRPVPRLAGRVPGHFKMLTARATTRIPTTREMADSTIIMSLAQVLTADTSVGLKAAAVANEKWK